MDIDYQGWMKHLCRESGTGWREQVLQPFVPTSSQVGKQRVNLALVGTELVKEEGLTISPDVGGLRLATPVELAAVLECKKACEFLRVEGRTILALGAYVQNCPDERFEEHGCFSLSGVPEEGSDSHRIGLVKLPLRINSRRWWNIKPLILIVII
ncbi:TPA: hypothetical protein DEP86_01185 [Candidatus Uhrbacteria bacterium]|nr:hypothetical protein [Candidatus Uhrbacteria bacterium]